MKLLIMFIHETFIYLYIKNWILHESKITYLEVRHLRRLEHICYVKKWLSILNIISIIDAENLVKSLLQTNLLSVQR